MKSNYNSLVSNVNFVNQQMISMSAEVIHFRHIMLCEYRKFGNADLATKEISEFDENELILCPCLGD